MESLQFSIIAFGLSLLTGNLAWIFNFRWLGICSIVVFGIALFVLWFYYNTIELLYDTETSWKGVMGLIIKIGGIYGFMVSTTTMTDFLGTKNLWSFALQIVWIAVALFIIIATGVSMYKVKSKRELGTV